MWLLPIEIDSISQRTMRFKFLATAISFLPFSALSVFGQDGWEEHTIEGFYTKVDLKDGVLDESGNTIDFVFVPAEIKEGTYEVEITDGPGDLYEIKGTEYFCKFTSYYGYAGYGEQGVLKVESGYPSSAFFKKN